MVSEAGHPLEGSRATGQGVPDGLVSEGRAGEAKRATQSDTRPDTLQDTLFSPERHPRHPNIDISATPVPRRVMFASCASVARLPEEGV